MNLAFQSEHFRLFRCWHNCWRCPALSTSFILIAYFKLNTSILIKSVTTYSGYWMRTVVSHKQKSCTYIYNIQYRIHITHNCIRWAKAISGWLRSAMESILWTCCFDAKPNKTYTQIVKLLHCENHQHISYESIHQTNITLFMFCRQNSK